MTYGAAYWAIEDDEEIVKLGYDDSKKLSEGERERMFKGINDEASRFEARAWVIGSGVGCAGWYSRELGGLGVNGCLRNGWYTGT